MQVHWFCHQCKSISDACVRENGEKIPLAEIFDVIEGDEEGVFLYCDVCGEAVGFARAVKDTHFGGAFVYEGNVSFIYTSHPVPSSEQGGEQHGGEDES